MKNFSYPSYTDVESDITLIAHHLTASNINPDVILGLSRGGLLPAIILSNIFKKPMLPVTYSSKHGKGTGRHNNLLPELTPQDNTILIVDDICDSGNTLKEITEIYQKQGNTVYTAVLFYKSPNEAGFKPSAYGRKIPASSPFIIFPWEVDLNIHVIS